MRPSPQRILIGATAAAIVVAVSACGGGNAGSCIFASACSDEGGGPVSSGDSAAPFIVFSVTGRVGAMASITILTPNSGAVSHRVEVPWSLQVKGAAGQSYTINGIYNPIFSGGEIPLQLDIYANGKLRSSAQQTSAIDVASTWFDCC